MRFLLFNKGLEKVRFIIVFCLKDTGINLGVFLVILEVRFALWCKGEG